MNPIANRIWGNLQSKENAQRSDESGVDKDVQKLVIKDIDF